MPVWRCDRFICQRGLPPCGGQPTSNQPWRTKSRARSRLETSGSPTCHVRQRSHTQAASSTTEALSGSGVVRQVVLRRAVRCRAGWLHNRKRPGISVLHRPPSSRGASAHSALDDRIGPQGPAKLCRIDSRRTATGRCRDRGRCADRPVDPGAIHLDPSSGRVREGSAPVALPKGRTLQGLDRLSSSGPRTAAAGITPWRSAIFLRAMDRSS